MPTKFFVEVGRYSLKNRSPFGVAVAEAWIGSVSVGRSQCQEFVWLGLSQVTIIDQTPYIWYVYLHHSQSICLYSMQSSVVYCIQKKGLHTLLITTGSRHASVTNEGRILQSMYHIKTVAIRFDYILIEVSSIHRSTLTSTKVNSPQQGLIWFHSFARSHHKKHTFVPSYLRSQSIINMIVIKSYEGKSYHILPNFFRPLQRFIRLLIGRELDHLQKSRQNNRTVIFCF